MITFCFSLSALFLFAVFIKPGLSAVAKNEQIDLEVFDLLSQS